MSIPLTHFFSTDSKREIAVRITGHIVFAGTAAFFLVYLRAPHAPLPAGSAAEPVSFIRYLGAAVTLWGALHGAYYFVVSQAHFVAAWFRAFFVVVFGITILLAFAAMACHESLVLHAFIIHLVLSSYLFWDVAARRYYRSKSRTWFKYYGELRAHDLLFWLIYSAVAYLGFEPRGNLGTWRTIFDLFLRSTPALLQRFLTRSH